MISKNIINHLKEGLTPEEKTKKILQESEEKYRKLIEIANDAIFLADIETGIILEANKQTEKLLGVPVEEIVGMHHAQIYPPEDVERNKELFKKYTQFDKSITSENIFVLHKDGRKMPVEISSSVFRLGGKKVILGIFHDITERNLAEKMLLESSEEKYHILANSTKAISWICDVSTWQFTFVGAYAETLLGYRIEEWYQENFWQNHIHPDDREQTINYCVTSTQRLEDHEFEYRMIASDGQIIWIYDIAKVTHSKGEPIQLHGFMIDITERKKVEAELKKIFDLSIDLICIAGIDGYFKKINPSFGKTLGYSNEELLGQPFINFVHPDDKTTTLDVVENELSKGTDVINFENRYRCKNGSYRWFMWTAKPVINEGIMFGIARDITKLKHDDEELKKHRDHLKALVAERTLELAKVNEKLLIEIGERKQAEETLQEQKKALEKKNIALSEILGQIEIEKKQIKDNVIANAETLLFPIVQKLRLTGESRKYVQLLQKNLQELASSFGTRLTEKETKLTSREIEICNMIKNGLTSKEIASLLNISLRTAEKHRINIRNKLGIVNKGLNLASFLQTL